MKNLQEKTTVALLAAAMGWLLYLGIGGTWGIVAGCGLLAVCIFLLALDLVPQGRNGFRWPLLADAAMVAGAVCIFLPGYSLDLRIFFALLGIAGLAGIVFWFAGKCYEGKTVKTLLSEEFRLPPFCDVALLIGLLRDFQKSSITLIGVLVAVFCIFDLIRQVIVRKKSFSFWC